MNLLLDTHTIIWFCANSINLSESSKNLISNAKNNIHVSIVSLWEMAIKLKINKLNLDISLESFVQELKLRRFIFLPIKIEHILNVSKLDLYHKDPFDRLLISQAIVENMDIISKDEQFDDYLVDKSILRIW
jgi:PIN domain nuclease of toxin-antitoxin system